jgi:hypothetical protein
MNRWLSNPRVRRFVTPESVLLVVAIGLAAYAYNGMGPRSDARDDRANIERRLDAARSDLADLRSGSQAEALRQELEDIKATQLPVLPPLANALEFGTEVTAYAASAQLTLDAFDVASATFESGGVKHPAISYAIDARGTGEAVVPVLDITSRYPTSVIRDLKLTRPEDPAGHWILHFIVIVVHSGA